MTKLQYIQYLIATNGNYTCTNLSNHLEDEPGTSHDAISDYLRREKLTPRGLWELVAPLIQNGADGYLILDDSVQDKRHSKAIELVKLQYSGAEQGLVRGINVVNLMHSSGPNRDYFPIDFRNYDDKSDGKTKNEHFREMLVRAVADKGIKARTVLFDSWYATAENLKLVHQLNFFFVTTLKSNRKVAPTKESGFIDLQEIVWTSESLASGTVVKLKEHPYLARLFKLVATNGDSERAITNKNTTGGFDGGHPRPITASDVQNESAVRWQIEQMHRELKQLTGSEMCQCRKARSQRNHIACCYQAWLALKMAARGRAISIYAAQADLWRRHLIGELRNPQIKAYAG